MKCTFILRSMSFKNNVIHINILKCNEKHTIIILNTTIIEKVHAYICACVFIFLLVNIILEYNSQTCTDIFENYSNFSSYDLDCPERLPEKS